MILGEHKDLEPVRGKGENSIEKQEREDAENGCLPDSLTVLGGLGSESDLSLFNSHFLMIFLNQIFLTLSYLQI